MTSFVSKVWSWLAKKRTMSGKQGVPLLDQLEDDDEEVDSDDELDFDPTKIRLRVPRGVFARRSRRGCLIAIIIGSLVSLVVLVVLGALLGILFAPQAPYAITGTVTKSPQDLREYQVIELNTDLRVLVISDPTTDVSAAAMDVAVGSFSDTVFGLAHFCEHMLFYASKKYPVEDEYSDFLSRNGGYDNAYTSTENTNYYFRVNADALSEALDRFAQFFIAPIFTQDGVNREMNAVNAEHLKNLQSDGWRVWQLLKQLSNPKHPFHNFNTGDLQTLNRSDILSKLTSFYNAHYSSNQMQLVIYGREDTNTLANYAYNMFSAVQNTNKTADFFSDTSFPPTYVGKLVYYEPVADKHTLSIYWQVNSQRDNYLQHVIPFLNSLIGDEGRGSIINYLRQQHLATDLSAGLELQTESYSLMVIDITLTVGGVSQVSDVVGVVMQYMMLLRNLDNSTLRSLWEDYIQASTIKFNYAAKTSPSDYASQLASNMRNIEFPQDFLLNPRRFVYDGALIRSVVNNLLPLNPLVLLGTPQFKPSGTFNDSSTKPFPSPSYPLSNTEPIYGTRYTTMEITQQLRSYWTTANLPNLVLAVPGKNQFIPTDLSLLPVTSGDTPIKVDESLKATSVWWSQSRLFREPKVHMYCDVNSSTTNITPQWAVLSMLYTQLVSTILLPTLYPATTLGYSFTLSPTTGGVSMHLSGYSDVAVTNQILTNITQVLTDQAVLSQGNSFSLSMEALTTTLSTYNTTTLPFRYTYQYIQQAVMERPYWKHWQLLNELNKIKALPTNAAMATLWAHIVQLYGTGSTVTCFLHGNIAKSTAVHHSMMISQLLHSSSSDPIRHFPRRRLSLSPANYSVIVPTLDPNDQNSVVNVIFQTGTQCSVSGGKCSSASLKSSALLGLLSLQIKQSCFDVLRTQQQLGYAVFCITRSNQNINSFQFIIQSGTYNASTVLSRINQFLQDSLAPIQAVASDGGKFNTLRDSYRVVLNRKYIAMSDAASDLWTEISTGREQFDFNTQLVNTLSSIAGNDLSSFYTTNLLNHDTAKKLVIAVYGKNRSNDLMATFDHVINYTTLSPSTNSYP